MTWDTKWIIHQNILNYFHYFDAFSCLMHLAYLITDICLISVHLNNNQAALTAR